MMWLVEEMGVEKFRTPRYMHHFVYEHPIFRYHDVKVGADRVLGEVGEGFAPGGIACRD